VKQRIKTFLAGVVLALALFCVAAAGSFEDGDAAYPRRLRGGVDLNRRVRGAKRGR